MKSLFTPWRYPYLLSEKPPAGECIFCEALARRDDEKSLVVYRGVRNFVILNMYPYTNGHVMVVPNDHLAFPSDSAAESRGELLDLAAACESALRSAYRADGINMGMNLGRAAGAGVESHYHLHVLPRWDGDTNFMAATADTRIIPEDLQQTRERLRRELLSRVGPERSPAGA